MPRPTRLVDLHCDWLLQYAGETTVFDPSLYPGVASRLGQAAGYLQGTAVAVLACYRIAEDWARQRDPWSALSALIARAEAEFPGRLLIGPDDVARRRDDLDGLCWGVVGVEGFDAMVRTPADLDRLPPLFERGVRVFQPVYGPSSALGGSSAAGDDRGLTDLGRAFLETLAALALGPDGPRPLLDLAHLSPAAASDVLAWFEADPARAASLIPVYSHGAVRHAGFESPRALTVENLVKLRALGGTVGFSVGPPFYPDPASLKAGIEAAAAVPFLGRDGFEGIAVGTDFLGVNQTLPGLGNADEVVAWFETAFAAMSAPLLAGNALRLLERCAGGS